MRNILFLLLLPVVLFAQGPLGLQYSHPKPFPMSITWAQYMGANTIYGVGSAGTFFKSTDDGQTWSLNYGAGVPSSGVVTYGINKAQFLDNNTGYTVGTAGITFTSDGGATFVNRSGSFTSSVTVYDLHFLDVNTGYISGTSSVKLAKTTDGGQTWTVNATLPSSAYRAFHYFSENRIFVVGNNTSSANIRFTTDGGLTWNARTAGTSTLYDIEFADSLTGYVAGGSGTCYKTTDGGETWTALTTGFTSSPFVSIKLVSANEFYLVGSAWDLYRTTDGGASFSPINFRSTSFDWSGNSTWLTNNGNNWFLAGAAGFYYRSTDNGATWATPSETKKIGFLQNIHGHHPSGTIIAVGSASSSAKGQQVLYSNNWGNTWRTADIPDISKDLRGVHMINATKAFAVGSGGNIYRTTDAGQTWDSVLNTSIYALSRVKFYDDNLGFATGNNGYIWKTTDGGATWTNKSVAGVTSTFGSIEFINASTIILGGPRTLVLKSTDAGETFQQIVTAFPTTQGLAQITMADSLFGYAVGSTGVSGIGYVWSTSDGGLTWAATGYPPAFSTFQNYAVVTRGRNEIYVAGANGTLYRSTDAGTNWTGYATGLSSNIFSMWLAHPDTIYATSGASGAAASVFKIPLPTVIPVELASFSAEVNGKNVFLSWKTATETNNSGFNIERKTTDGSWTEAGYVRGKGTTTGGNSYSFVDEVTTGRYSYRLKQVDFDGTYEYHELKNEVEVGSPATFTLMQNYPNPFNPSTSISFVLPADEVVTLKVYNTIGEEVATILNQKMTAGYHKVEFNASGIPSGVYIYRITAGSNTAVRKMSLLK